MKPIPTTKVIDWLNHQHTEELFISTITIAEISYGLGVLPESKRKLILSNQFYQFTREAFFNRILIFDENAAHFYGKIMADQKKIGKSMSVTDGQIAGIAATNNYQLITRNIKDFEHTGLSLLNPF